MLITPLVNGLKVTSSQALRNGGGVVTGIFVSQASSTPTIKLWDSSAASGTELIDTFTPTAGTMYNFGARVNFKTGLFITIGGTVSCTVFYE